MNDTPGRASPGSAPSEGRGADVPRPSEPVDGSGPAGNGSATRPPAEQWSPPPTGRTAGPQGPGWGGGPYGPVWGQPPAAAKPGVIPLRPLGVGEILDGAVSTMRAHWRTVLGITLTVSVLAQIATTAIERFLLPKPEPIDPNATAAEAVRRITDSAQSAAYTSLPSLVITMIATLICTAVLTVVVSRSVLGRPVTLSEAWAEARSRLPRLLGLTLLVALLGSAVMAVGVFPGALIGDVAGAGLVLLGGAAGLAALIWLWVRFSLAAPALMLERQSVIASMRRSAKLVKGAWWRTFGILALTMLLTLVAALVVALLISIPLGIIAVASGGNEAGSAFMSGSTNLDWPFLIVSGIADVIISMITYPLTAGVTVLLYVDQRIRREALDLELGRAAGLPEYDTGS
ncbi:glycerophosphoryl diester phosphodiesterase membrane domain-containing protein [Streptomyces sp. NPDC056347]|uniref:DUF7544 domain-containing protein n=1 Tax=Streptomyces sp. NPDC056347 TaxID=3345790 RepID=UPI0035D96C42